MPIEPGVGYSFHYAADQPIPQLLLPLNLLVHFPKQPTPRPRPSPQFPPHSLSLPGGCAPGHRRGSRISLTPAHIQGTDTLGTVKFVGRQAQKVHPQLLDINRDMAHCLYRIGVERDLPLLEDLADLGNGLDSSDLIIGVHDTTTKIVSGVKAAATAAGSTKPYESTGSTVILKPCFSRYRHVLYTAWCSMADVIIWLPRSFRAKAAPLMAKLSASEPLM